jgi:hypothetical protein
MIRRQAALAAILVAWIGSCAFAQELTTDAERDWRAIRSSDDTRTKIMAERWYNAVKQQEWCNASGKFKTSAKYVEHDPNLEWVKLRVIRGTGKERVVKDVQIPLDKLSKACQSRVRTISVLAPKVAEAIEEEANKEAEDENDPAGSRGGEFMGEDPAADDSRGGRDSIDRRREEPDPRRSRGEGDNPRRGRRGRAQSEEPLVVTNDGPPLPAALPPLPSTASTEATSQSTTDEAAPVVAGAEKVAGPDAAHHPVSAEELEAAFAAAFAAGDKVALEELVFWGELAPELRQLTHARLLDYAGIAQLRRCNLAVKEPGEPGELYTLSSATHLSLEFETRAEFFDMTWPVGEVDGKYYLGALSGAAPAERR